MSKANTLTEQTKSKDPVKEIIASHGDYYSKLAQYYRGLGMVFEFHLFKEAARELHRMAGKLRGGQDRK
ncbi:hypothetical protein A2767_03405 [Candidatus Roizmanbacteria bacterium RIFCSPHIGHO2_01_FULL_35_10]|uniref:Uncharacterized protein n=1 Tax=Candidatus Roizmanbacteria bacterium RIFCSPLOWO2_01_FULL_35_13 TaxID=1802055 RepID=A0A1F7I8M1_9BACT|nr:MAG: hypothetical protein A2767_03405 [Candidatus Roizmanbacteria bacterium RIFCSPHIGHO2_01_FULL_35_10]OGK39708.1 MAG: hypothetical protein A3A74_04400 [Candidatus Roizmanbacteria bacterium RIFCSPLOWO2_01_FULL_35_13]